MFECIFFPGISLLHYFMVPHVPDYGNRSPDKEELHYSVVERHVPREQIEVAREEDDDIQFLSLERNTCANKVNLRSLQNKRCWKYIKILQWKADEWRVS